MIEVKLLDSMGDDLTVCNAARVSFGKESEWQWVDDGKVEWGEPDSQNVVEAIRWPAEPPGTVRNGAGHLRSLSKKDAKLISYLAEHEHWAPFAHPQASFHVKAPIFVRAQCFKHKVGFVESEISRRYVDSEPEFYLPQVWRGRPTGGAKQGSSGEVDLNVVQWWPTGVKESALGCVKRFYEDALDTYQGLLTSGVAPEQARMVLPQAMMTEWRWTGSLAAWARFCRLRLAPDAQGETREIAGLVADRMADLFPISWAALAGWRAEK